MDGHDLFDIDDGGNAEFEAYQRSIADVVGDEIMCTGDAVSKRVRYHPTLQVTNRLPMLNPML